MNIHTCHSHVISDYSYQSKGVYTYLRHYLLRGRLQNHLDVGGGGGLVTFSDVLNKTIAFGLPQTFDTNDGGGGGGGGGR